MKNKEQPTQIKQLIKLCYIPVKSIGHFLVIYPLLIVRFALRKFKPDKKDITHYIISDNGVLVKTACQRTYLTEYYLSKDNHHHISKYEKGITCEICSKILSDHQRLKK